MGIWRLADYVLSLNPGRFPLLVLRIPENMVHVGCRDTALSLLEKGKKPQVKGGLYGIDEDI